MSRTTFHIRAATNLDKVNSGAEEKLELAPAEMKEKKKKKRGERCSVSRNASPRLTAVIWGTGEQSRDREEGWP